MFKEADVEAATKDDDGAQPLLATFPVWQPAGTNEDKAAPPLSPHVKGPQEPPFLMSALAPG